MWSKENIQCFAICSNDQANYPADSPQKMAELAEEKNFLFPICMMNVNKLPKLYKAACTPDFFLFDKEKELFYRGQYDSSRPGNELKVCGSDLEQAVKNLQKGLPSPKQQIPSIGCNIKWKKETNQVSSSKRSQSLTYLEVITYTPSQSSPGGFSFMIWQRSIRIMRRDCP